MLFLLMLQHCIGNSQPSFCFFRLLNIAQYPTNTICLRPCHSLAKVAIRPATVGTIRGRSCDLLSKSVINRKPYGVVQIQVFVWCYQMRLCCFYTKSMRFLKVALRFKLPGISQYTTAMPVTSSVIHPSWMPYILVVHKSRYKTSNDTC